jgi:hypothetical protein
VLAAAGDVRGATAALRREVDLRRRICAATAASTLDREELERDEMEMHTLEGAIRRGDKGLAATGEPAAAN